MFLYADPGLGTLILQLIGALLIGGLFYIRKFRLKIREWLDKLTGRGH